MHKKSLPLLHYKPDPIYLLWNWYFQYKLYTSFYLYEFYAVLLHKVAKRLPQVLIFYRFFIARPPAVNYPEIEIALGNIIDDVCRVRI